MISYVTLTLASIHDFPCYFHAIITFEGHPRIRTLSTIGFYNLCSATPLRFWLARADCNLLVDYMSSVGCFFSVSQARH